MKNQFLEKLYNKDYISNNLYEMVLKNNPEVIPKNFDLDSYNDKYLEKNYIKYKEYFSNMFKNIDENIVLDKDQIKSILSDEDYSLVIAGAGSGKTTTIAAKVKYLVDIKKIDPEKIVVISYTKMSTEELKNKIVIDFSLNCNVTTFHTLAMMYIREIFKNRKCYIVDDSLREKIFYDYFKENIFPYKNKIKEILDIFIVNKTTNRFIFGSHFINNYDKFKNFDDYFEDYKKYKYHEAINIKEIIKEKIDKDINSLNPITIKGELVKSKGEAIIANFLYQNNIEYYYEKIYKETMNDYRTYKPDFTLELNGEYIYIEYFGLSNSFTNNEYSRYKKIMLEKEEYHKNNHNKFIKLTYMNELDLINSLKEKLIKFGFILKARTDKEIYYQLLDNNKISQVFMYKKFLYDVIDSIKSSSNRKDFLNIVNNYLNKLNKDEKELAIQQFKYIYDFYYYYQNKLYSSEEYGFDFNDMIYYANLYMNKVSNNKLNFDYLIVDEYQDISRDRYLFIKNIINKNKACFEAVGDDWQTIYSFSGSKIDYIYNFTKYFEGSKVFKINNSYRNSQELIDASSSFIMKNENQIKKELLSFKHLYKPIKFILFEDNEYDVLKELILKIYNKNKNHRITILGRTNKIINKCFLDKDLKDGIGNKIDFLGYEDLYLEGMTIHSSKGITCDEVILIGLDSNFPRSNYGIFWLKSLFSDFECDESIPFAEERRLFYVALTRTKNYVYLLVNKDPRKRSPFINEIYNISSKY